MLNGTSIAVYLGRCAVAGPIGWGQHQIMSNGAPLPFPPSLRTTQQEGAVRETRKRGNNPPWNCLSRSSALPLILEVPSSCYGLMLAQSRMRRFQVWLKCEFARIRSVGGWETAGHAAGSRRGGCRSHAVNGCVPCQVASRAAGFHCLTLTGRQGQGLGWLVLTCSRPYAAQNCHFFLLHSLPEDPKSTNHVRKRMLRADTFAFFPVLP